MPRPVIALAPTVMRHALLGALLLAAPPAFADYACPAASDPRGGWIPEACVQSCPNCGVVASVTPPDAKASGLGAAAGAVAGGLLGNQVGKGSGRTLATIAGAVGGAVAGHYGEKKFFGKARWEVVVRMNDGSTRTVSLDHDPGVNAGERVQVGDNSVTRY